MVWRIQRGPWGSLTLSEERATAICSKFRNSYKRRKLVAGYHRMTIKLTEDQLLINLQTILRIILDDLEKTEVGARLCTTLSHGWAKGAHSHKLWIIYQALSDQPTLSQLYRYWRRVLGVLSTILKQRPEHGLKNLTTEAQKLFVQQTSIKGMFINLLIYTM